MSEMNVPSAPLSKVFAPPCLSRVVNLCNLWFENFTRRPSTTTGSLKWLSKLQNQGLNPAKAAKKDNIVIKKRQKSTIIAKSKVNLLGICSSATLKLLQMISVYANHLHHYIHNITGEALHH